MSEQTLRFRLGVFVLAALLLLAVLIMLFGGLPDLFKQYHRYTLIFEDASGVAPGTPVRQAGVRIGEVEKVGLNEETGKAEVSIKVDSRFVLRKNDRPVLVRGLIGGDTSIDFVRSRPREGPAEQPPLEPGSTLPGSSSAEAGDLAREAAKLLPAARETLEDVGRVFVRLDKMMPIMEETLREFRETAKAARTTLPELQRTNTELQAASISWRKAGDRFNGLLKANQDKITRALDSLDETMRRASAMFSEENQRNFTEGLRRSNEMLNRANLVMSDMQKASKPLADRTPSILRNLDEGTDRLNRALGDLQDLLRAGSKADGTLHRLLADPSLYNHLDEAACMITRLLPRVDRVLQDVETFADKIARHPEALGLGGVIRPGTGLKEAPLAPYYHSPGH
jgi:phospholipid/cholesterol/gamma-HCH transport system substrate-binding protein